MVDLSLLNPLHNKEDALGAYALYLPAISPIYAKTLDRGTDKFIGRPLPEPIKNNLEALNFLNPSNPLFSSRWALYSAGNAELDLEKAKANNIESIIHNRDPASKLVGDCGGFQFLSGEWRYDTDDRGQMDALCDRVLKWQEGTCDVIMALDLPALFVAEPNKWKKSILKSYDQCLRGSLENFRFFERNRDYTLNKPILNVLQGTDFPAQQQWYEAVRDFRFEGWSFSWASHGSVQRVLHRLAIMKNDGKLENCQWIHFLGLARLRFAGALTLVMRALRRHVNPNLVISFDASSPMLMAGLIGKAYHNWWFKEKGTRSEMTFDYHSIPREVDFLGSKTPFPYLTSPIGQMLEMGHMCVNRNPKGNNSTWDGLSSSLLANHNTYVHLAAMLQINRFMDHALYGDTDICLPFEFGKFNEIVEYVLNPSTSFEAAVSRIYDHKDVLQWFDRKEVATVAQLIRPDNKVNWATTDLEPFPYATEHSWIGDGIEDCVY